MWNTIIERIESYETFEAEENQKVPCREWETVGIPQAALNNMDC
jgi:hypothetical protein